MIRLYIWREKKKKNNGEKIRVSSKGNAMMSESVSKKKEKTENKEIIYNSKN